MQCTQVTNAKLSDHKACLAQLTYHINPQEKQEKKNFIPTRIPNYDTGGADYEDWIRASKLLDMVKWQEILEDKSEDDAANIILHNMEDVVIKTMHLKENIKTHMNNVHEEVTECGFKSNNRIPRQVRKHMKRKHEASEGLKTVKSSKRCLKLREETRKCRK